jgi:putative peptidoglycan lipid II flippase
MATQQPPDAAPAPPPAAAAPAAPAAGAPPTHDLRAGRVVALGLLVSKPTGYLRDALLAARFGTGSAMGAYTIASTACTAIFDVIGTPLTRVLVPVLVAARRRRGAAGLAATAMAVLWAEGALALLAAVLLLLFAGPVASLLAGPAGPSRPELATLLRWLSLLPLGLVLSAYATAWLQAAERFTLPAFTGLPLDLTIIGFVLFYGHHGILAAAWGLLLGTFAQYALQWPGLRRLGHRVRAPAPRAALRDPGLAATATMALPLLGSAGAVEAVNLLQQALAARLPVGTVAAFGYAYRVLDLPSALFILPATAVVLPRLAAFAAAGDRETADRFFREAARALLAGLLPCALLVGFLAGPLSAALYEHGAFGPGSVADMARSLRGFAPGVVTYGLQQLLRTRFYARQDARTPLLWDVAALAATAAFDLLTYRFLGGLGLALGWSAGSGVAWAGMARAARRGPAAARAADRELLSLLAGAAALLAVLLLLRGHVPDWLGHRPWRAALAEVATAGSAAAAAYFLAVAATGGRAILRGLGGQLRRT